jgi:hypothetical protein
VTGEWRKLHNEEISDLHSSPITRIIRTLKKRRRMRGAGHVARIGDKGSIYVIDKKAKGKETTRKAKT